MFRIVYVLFEGREVLYNEHSIYIYLTICLHNCKAIYFNSWHIKKNNSYTVYYWLEKQRKHRMKTVEGVYYMEQKLNSNNFAKLLQAALIKGQTEKQLTVNDLIKEIVSQLESFMKK